MLTVKSAIKSQVQDINPLPPAVQFRIASIREGKCNLSSYNRRDFFKITLMKSGSTQLLYANREFKIDGPALIFTNPVVPFSWGNMCEQDDSAGFFCVFTEAFMAAQGNRESLQESVLFKSGGSPVFMLNDSQVAYIEG
ncbi:MAG TPA: hypothetical protein VGC08_07760, partial [Pedobacter sp.]